MKKIIVGLLAFLIVGDAAAQTTKNIESEEEVRGESDEEVDADELETLRAVAIELAKKAAARRKLAHYCVSDDDDAHFFLTYSHARLIMLPDLGSLMFICEGNSCRLDRSDSAIKESYVRTDLIFIRSDEDGRYTTVKLYSARDGRPLDIATIPITCTEFKLPE